MATTWPNAPPVRLKILLRKRHAGRNSSRFDFTHRDPEKSRRVSDQFLILFGNANRPDKVGITLNHKRTSFERKRWQP